MNFAGGVRTLKISNYYGAFSDGPFDPNGGASPADLVANEKGMAFWDSILAPGAIDRINNTPPGTQPFNICDYVDRNWDQKINPNVTGAMPGSTPGFL